MATAIASHDAWTQAAIASPAGFASYATRGKWLLKPHLRRLSLALEEAAGRKAARIVVEMPPRHGKSMLTSQYFPAWAVGTNPERQVLLASYEAGFAASWGMKARDALASFGPQLFGVRIHPEIASRDLWGVQRWDGRAWQTAEGMMSTAGIGGAITGKGAHVFVIDDPFKNWEDAQSKANHNRVWDWYRSTAYTRLEPEGSIMVVMTRWHEDDLVGRITSGQDDEDPYAENWQVIKLAALAEEEDPLGREPGEALWPNRYSRERLKIIEKSVGSMIFACLYQQNPAPAGGNVFKRKYFRYFRRFEDYVLLYPTDGEIPKRYARKLLTPIAYVDPALSEDERNDPTVQLVILRAPGGEILVDEVEREWVESPDVKSMIRAGHAKWRPAKIGVESVAYQASIVQDLQREGLPIVKVDVEGNKFTRAVTTATRVQQGSTYFRADAPWLEPFERELLQYPNAAHDDQVDALGFALADQIAGGALAPVVGKVIEKHDNVLHAHF